MGFFQNIRNAIGRLFNSNRGSRVYTVGGQEVYSPITTRDAIEKGFNTNAAVYSITIKAAEKFGVVPRYVYAKDRAEEKSFLVKAQRNIYNKNKDLNNLLNRPNETEGQDSFLEKVAACYTVAGEAFVWLNRGDIEGLEDKAMETMPIFEMYVIPPHYITVVPDEENVFGIKDYIFEGDGVRQRLGKPNVIHWKKTNLKFNISSREHLRGMTPLEPGADTVQQYEDSTRASVRMYQNDGAKGVLAEENPTAKNPAQEYDIKSVINKKINNNDIKGSVAYLQGKWQYIDLGKSNTDMGLLDGKNMTWKELCFLMGVPYAYFNPEIAYADQNKAGIDFVSNKIIPLCKKFDGELNRVLLPAFGLEGTAFIASDFSDLPEVQQMNYEIADRLSKIWQIKPDEVRAQLGYEAIGNEFDEPWVPTGYVPLSQVNDFDDEASELVARGLNDTNGKGMVLYDRN